MFDPNNFVVAGNVVSTKKQPARRKKQPAPLQDILDRLRAAKPILQKQYNTTLVGLFGSYARGEEKPESDVDILVVFGEGSSLSTLGGVLNFLEDCIEKKVDVADEPHLRNLYKPFIYKDLIRL